MNPEIRNALLAILFLNIIGIVAYHYFEGWNWVDSIYFTSATLTTVGYGDIVPKTTFGRLFTIIFMWSGVSIGFYTLTLLSRHQGENLQKNINRLRSIESRITRLMPWNTDEPQVPGPKKKK